MEPLAQPIGEIKPHYDLVVIGSGYGGGVTASRMARAGLSVCVLERGREFPTGSFPDRFPDIRRELRVRGGKVDMGSDTSLFDIRIGQHIHVLVGCGLGGGSLVNAGVALRPDDRVFADPAWPEALSGDGLLDEGFDRANRMLRPASYADAKNLTKYKALENACKPLNAGPQPAEVVVSFDETVNPAGIAQPACTLCGDCCTGCNVGAKNTVAMTYLPDARHHGAEMFTETSVRHVEKTSSGWRIHYAPAGKKANGSEPGSISADMVMLSAGTLGSTEILLRSRENGLAVSDRLGAGFSANGDIIAFGYGAKTPVNAIGVGHPAKAEIETVGPCVAGQTRINDLEDLDKSLYIQEGVMPSGVAPLLPALFVPGGRILGAAQSLIKGVYNGPFRNLHTFFVVSHDDAAGRMELDSDRLAIDWPDVADHPVFERVDNVLDTAVTSAGGSYVKHLFAATSAGKKPATAHPLGGCGMGESAETGVVDHKGQVFDGTSGEVHRGLYVSDGSVMPRSLGVNPLLTITSLTERAMIHMARDLNLNFDDAPITAE